MTGGRASWQAALRLVAVEQRVHPLLRARAGVEGVVRIRGCHDVRRSATRCSMNFMVHSWLMLSKKAPSVRIEHPVHSLPLDARHQRVQRLVRAAAGTKTVRKAFEVDLVYLIEDRHHSLLNDFVLQGRDARRTLPPVGLRDINSS